MKIECTLAELLYIGSVAEKGRCYGRRWSRKYRSIIKLHMMLLGKICSCFLDNSSIDRVLEELKVACENESEIGKIYSIIKWEEKIQWSSDQEKHTKIVSIMEKLLNEIAYELDKIFVNKRKVYLLLQSFHNFPRVFFDENEKTLGGLNYKPISENEAMEYAFSNLPEIKKWFLD